MCASDARASSPRISVMRRCSASGKARHRRTSPGPTTSIRPPSAAWQLPALSSTARSSPSEALGSALRPRSPGAFPASARGLLTPHRLSSEGDTMNIRLPAATQSIHRRMELTVLQLAPRGSATCPGFFSGACANWLWPAPRLAPRTRFPLSYCGAPPGASGAARTSMNPSPSSLLHWIRICGWKLMPPPLTKCVM